jgi:hypothetical protein
MGEKYISELGTEQPAAKAPSFLLHGNKTLRLVHLTDFAMIPRSVQN